MDIIKKRLSLWKLIPYKRKQGKMITMRRLIYWSLLFLFGLTACGSYKVVKLPLREADLYPLSQTREGITVAIDEIGNPERAMKFFDVNLIKKGILPINIVVSNHGEHRAVLKPSDVMVLRGKEVIDPLPIEAVAEIAKRDSLFITDKTSQQIEKFLSNISLTETILIPNESYHGVLFFKVAIRKKKQYRFFTIVRLFREESPKVRIAITDLETNKRLHFGPFPLSGI